MRTTTTSVTKTCPDCGTLNKVLIITSGIPPRWRIGCSGCHRTIFGAPDHVSPPRSAQIVRLPVPAMRARRELSPSGVGPGRLSRFGRHAALPAIAGRRRQELPRHLRAIRASARVSTGVSLAAICGIVLASIVLQGEPATGVATGGGAPAGSLPASTAQVAAAQVTAAQGTDSQVGVPQAAGGQPTAAQPAGATGLAEAGNARPPAPVYSYPRLSAPSGPTIPGVPDEATAAAGDPGIASIVDLRRPIKGAYPDPREGMGILAEADRRRTDIAAVAEDELGLSAGKRREVQLRLRLARHDPQSIDGVFGPVTRSAIAEWQREAGIPATGYVDEAALALLADTTETEYRAWRTAEKARRDAQQVAAATPLPRPDRAVADDCARHLSGEVAYGQSVRCDFRGLRESIGTLGGALAGLFDTDTPGRSPLAQSRENRHRPGGA